MSVSDGPRRITFCGLSKHSCSRMFRIRTDCPFFGNFALAKTCQLASTRAACGNRQVRGPLANGCGKLLATSCRAPLKV